jgi:AraC-like DNA-binding protein
MESMTGTPDLLPATPLPPGGADVLSEVLRVVHLSGSVFLRGEFSEPWAFASPEASACAAMLGHGPGSLILFHVVVEGRCGVSLTRGDAAELGAGEVVMLPYADPHVMGWPRGAEPVPLLGVLPPQPWTQMPTVRMGAGSVQTRVLCGYLRCEDLLFHPLLSALPRILRVRPRTPAAADWLQASVRYAMDEAQRGRRMAELPELLFVDSLRQYAETLPETRTGWLAALHDPVVGRALVLLHGKPAQEWTVEQLARRVGASRTVLADRFAKKLGRSPMRYLVGWRVQLAAHLLRSSDLAIAEIADRVGYAAEAAFNRAFKREIGKPPAAFRAGEAR